MAAAGKQADRFEAAGGLLVAGGTAAALALMPLAFWPGLYDDFTLLKQAVLIASSGAIVAGLALCPWLLPRDQATRLLVGAWLAWLTLTVAAGVDPRGSILGVYQYRQGYLTQVGYVLLLMGGSATGRLGRECWLFVAVAAGLLGTSVYSALQGFGADPVDWWIDTSERAIGTIGNANELAAYCLAALAVVALAPVRALRRVSGAVVVFGGLAAFNAFEAESRSGLFALGCAWVASVALGVVLRLERRWLAATAGGLLAGFALGAVLSLAVGGAGGTAERATGPGADVEQSGSTRLALWEGTVHTIAASPARGFGPDGLALAFPRHRPAALGGAYRDYDLVAQSSHNAILDVAANNGLVGVALLGGLMLRVAWRSLVRSPKDRTSDERARLALGWGAAAGYLALTLVNPISIAGHATFFALAGVFAAKAEPARARAIAVRLPKALRPLPAAIAALAALTVAVLLPVADRRAEHAWTAFAAGDFSLAARRYHDASRLVPWERRYARAEGEALLAAGVRQDYGALARAEEQFERFDERFGFASGEAVALATARIGLERPASRIVPVADEAERLNPHGVSIGKYAATLRVAAREGGVLLYSERDRWVYVEACVVPKPAGCP